MECPEPFKPLIVTKRVHDLGMNSNHHFIHKIMLRTLAGVLRRINSGIFREDLPKCGGDKMEALKPPKWKE